MSEPMDYTTTATYSIRERQYEIRRSQCPYTERPLFDVVDIDTGLILTSPPFFTEPDPAEIERLLDELIGDVETDMIDSVFEGEHERLSRAIGRTIVIQGRSITVRPSQRWSWHVGGWDLVENDTVLNTADPFRSPPSPTQVAAFLTPQRQRLDRLMAKFKIVAGADYQYEDIYEVLHGTDPVPRFVAITRDETYAFFDLVPTLNEALHVLESRVGDESGGTIYGIHDLHEDVLLSVQYRTRVWVVNDPGSQDEQQPGTHRVSVRLAWQERVAYDQVIDIDVPNGYVGDLKDLIDIDDLPGTKADGVEGVPAGFVTNWIERADFDAAISVSNRVVTAFYGPVAPAGQLGDASTG